MEEQAAKPAKPIGRRKLWGAPVDQSSQPNGDAIAKAEADAAKKRERRTRWEAAPAEPEKPTPSSGPHQHSTENLPIKPLSLSLSQLIDPTQLQNIRLNAELHLVNQKLQDASKGQVLEGQRSPSPEPIYNEAGQRTNTRAQRTADRLLSRRNVIISELIKSNPQYKPPADYRAETKTRKLRIPQDEFPGYNFLGLIIGPRGNTQKRLEQESGARITIRGRGSIKEGRAQRDSDAHEETHVLITADTDEQLNKASAMVEILLNPTPDDTMTHHKRQQLRLLASLNGTLRDDEGLGAAEGEGGGEVYQLPEHLQGKVDAQYAKDTVAVHGRDAKEIESEYKNFMQQLGGGAPRELMGEASNRQRGEQPPGSGRAAHYEGSHEPLGPQLPSPPQAQARYDEQDPCALYVGYLGPQVDEPMLVHLFSSVGHVTECRVIRDRNTGQSKGFGFVHMATEQQAQACVDHLNLFMMQGKRLSVRPRGQRGPGPAPASAYPYPPPPGAWPGQPHSGASHVQPELLPGEEQPPGFTEHGDSSTAHRDRHILLPPPPQLPTGDRPPSYHYPYPGYPPHPHPQDQQSAPPAADVSEAQLAADRAMQRRRARRLLAAVGLPGSLSPTPAAVVEPATGAQQHGGDSQEQVPAPAYPLPPPPSQMDNQALWAQYAAQYPSMPDESEPPVPGLEEWPQDSTDLQGGILEPVPHDDGTYSDPSQYMSASEYAAFMGYEEPATGTWGVAEEAPPGVEPGSGGTEAAMAAEPSKKKRVRGRKQRPGEEGEGGPVVVQVVQLDPQEAERLRKKREDDEAARQKAAREKEERLKEMERQRREESLAQAAARAAAASLAQQQLRLATEPPLPLGPPPPEPPSGRAQSPPRSKARHGRSRSPHGRSRSPHARRTAVRRRSKSPVAGIGGIRGRVRPVSPSLVRKRPRRSRTPPSPLHAPHRRVSPSSQFVLGRRSLSPARGAALDRGPPITGFRAGSGQSRRSLRAPASERERYVSPEPKPKQAPPVVVEAEEGELEEGELGEAELEVAPKDSRSGAPAGRRSAERRHSRGHSRDRDRMGMERDRERPREWGRGDREWGQNGAGLHARDGQGWYDEEEGWGYEQDAGMFMQPEMLQVAMMQAMQMQAMLQQRGMGGY